MPDNVKVTVLTDRGFSDHKFLRFLSEELQFYYVIRIKSNTTIITKNESFKATECLDKGKITTLRDIGVTLQNYVVPTFVATQDKA
ncbi:MAG: transposase [Gammaproteobacteria bacterium]|nr:transposase [Gammaproteobacteria bacterium]